MPAKHMGSRTTAGRWHDPEVEREIAEKVEVENNKYPLLFFSKDPEHGFPIARPYLSHATVPCESHNAYAKTDVN